MKDLKLTAVHKTNTAEQSVVLMALSTKTHLKDVRFVLVKILAMITVVIKVKNALLISIQDLLDEIHSFQFAETLQNQENVHQSLQTQPDANVSATMIPTAEKAISVVQTDVEWFAFQLIHLLLSHKHHKIP